MALARLRIFQQYTDVKDWSSISGFEWDAGNARKSASKHGVSQAEAEQVFFNQPLLITPDIKNSQQETRYHALGRTDGRRPLHITFTLREDGKLIRVISARDMHRKERIIYDRAT
ncbi:BrnT family toxin [Thioalkalivibrio sp.]|uniref:BrnT family toxin n=1 Tax=Thioalkalivibrio sp. TaxID=2093813 RepID=UPI003569D699